MIEHEITMAEIAIARIKGVLRTKHEDDLRILATALGQILIERKITHSQSKSP